MLFHKLYNWLKFKTLPSSVLYKNRLFIERESKNRRVFNNFGLIFRNSKWSQYENLNINFFFKLSYFNFIFIIFFFFLFIKFLSFNLFSFIWLSFESICYFFVFTFWFFNFFLISSIFKVKLFLNFNKKTTNSYDSDNINFYSFRTNFFYLDFYNYFSDINIELEESFFSNFIKKKNWNNFTDLFIHMYQNFFFFNKNKQPSIYNSKNLIKNFYSNFNDASNFIFKNNNCKDLYTNLNNWSIFFFLNENNKYFFKNKSSLNLNFSNFTDLHNFFFFLNKNTELKLQNSKINRWLYRYSLIHRKSFKTIQKLNFFKKLISSSNYSSSFFKKNLWNSQFFLKKKSNTSFFNFNILFYPNQNSELNPFFKYSNQNNIFQYNSINFNKLNFFDSSYSWNLKRYYLFNSLNNNFFTSSYNFNKNINKKKNILNFSNTQISDFFFKNKLEYLTDLNSFKSTKLKNLEKNFENNLLKKINLNSTEYSFFNYENLSFFDSLINNNFFYIEKNYIKLNKNIRLKKYITRPIKKKTNNYFFNFFFTKSINNANLININKDLKNL